jgi:hypothetical protein
MIKTTSRHGLSSSPPEANSRSKAQPLEFQQVREDYAGIFREKLQESRLSVSSSRSINAQKELIQETTTSGHSSEINDIINDTKRRHG